MDRRAFLAGGAALLAAPLAAVAQQAGRIARVGLLIPTAPIPATATPRLGITMDLPLRLRELGWVEGASLVIEARFAHNRPDRLPSLAADLVRTAVDSMLAHS